MESLLRDVYAGVYAERYEVRTRKTEPNESDLSKAFRRLEDARVIRLDPDFGYPYYQAFDVLEQPAEAVSCTADSSVYISHLSAMQMHGLTDRNPVDLVLSRPAGMRPKVHFPGHVRGRPILLHETRHPGTWETMGPRIRVATIGQAFLDMVVRPHWCGGVTHILEVWEREAEVHLDAIVAAIDAHPAKLPKVRAGYILDEVLGIADARVLAWLAFAQRGSSQKLDSEQPYAPTFSAKWILSLNA